MEEADVEDTSEIPEALEIAMNEADQIVDQIEDETQELPASCQGAARTLPTQ